MLYLLLIGLIVNFIGIVLIAISFGGTVEGAQQTDSQGRKIYLAALLHPRVFLFGLSILGLGFLLQIISEVTAFFSQTESKIWHVPRANAGPSMVIGAKSGAGRTPVRRHEGTISRKKFACATKHD
jgi:hypothetical protein